MAGTVRIVLGVLFVLFGLVTLVLAVGWFFLLFGIVLILWGVSASRAANVSRQLRIIRRQQDQIIRTMSSSRPAPTPAPVVPPAPSTSAGLAGASPFLGQGSACPRCGRATTYVAPAQRNYCSSCQQYT